ncbi:MAG: hypothetical protein HYV07_00315 [Deltaproteobacteria bacterium]|nr:hypothetical protein [Deltaproteobacteria bacterium]
MDEIRLSASPDPSASNVGTGTSRLCRRSSTGAGGPGSTLEGSTLLSEGAWAASATAGSIVSLPFEGPDVRAVSPEGETGAGGVLARSSEASRSAAIWAFGAVEAGLEVLPALDPAGADGVGPGCASALGVARKAWSSLASFARSPPKPAVAEVGLPDPEEPS